MVQKFLKIKDQISLNPSLPQNILSFLPMSQMIVHTPACHQKPLSSLKGEQKRNSQIVAPVLLKPENLIPIPKKCSLQPLCLSSELKHPPQVRIETRAVNPLVLNAHNNAFNLAYPTTQIPIPQLGKNPAIPPIGLRIIQIPIVQQQKYHLPSTHNRIIVAQETMNKQ